MNVASLDLCKELYELSGWDNTQFLWLEDYGNPQWLHDDIKAPVDAPAYDLGFLLRKLPVHYPNTRHRLKLWLEPDHYLIGWTSKLLKSSDTPENAACSIAIELFKQGVLTRSEVAV